MGGTGERLFSQDEKVQCRGIQIILTVQTCTTIAGYTVPITKVGNATFVSQLMQAATLCRSTHTIPINKADSATSKTATVSTEFGRYMSLHEICSIKKHKDNPIKGTWQTGFGRYAVEAHVDISFQGSDMPGLIIVVVDVVVAVIRTIVVVVEKVVEVMVAVVVLFVVVVELEVVVVVVEVVVVVVLVVAALEVVVVVVLVELEAVVVVLMSFSTWDLLLFVGLSHLVYSTNFFDNASSCCLINSAGTLSLSLSTRGLEASYAAAQTSYL